MNQNYYTFSKNLTESRFKFFIVLFRIAGIPLYEKVPKLFKIYAAVITTFLYPCSAALILDFAVETEDLERIMMSARSAATSSVCLWTYTFLRFRPRKVMNLMRLTEPFSWETLPKREEDTGSLTMTGWIYFIQSIIQKIMISSFAYFIFHILTLVVSSNKTHFIYNMWLPYNASTSPAYEFTNLLQVFVSSVFTVTLFPFAGLYVTFVCIACTQLDKLNLALLKNRDIHNLSSDESDIQTEEDENIVERYGGTYKNINNCIKHHQEILSFLQTMEDTLNPVMAGIFLLVLINLCICSFSIVTSWGNFVQMMQAFMGYMLTLVVVAICCWFGYILSSQVESVRDAAWGCDWIGKPIPLQKSIRLIIAMANKDFTLTAGKFVPVTISTLVNMVNQSVSYFMFLLEVKTSLENTQSSVND